MGAYDDFLNKGSNYKKANGPEYYEDTHDRQGNYKAYPQGVTPQSIPQPMPQLSNLRVDRHSQYNNANQYGQAPMTAPLIGSVPNHEQYTQFQPKIQGMPLPTSNSEVIPRNYQNLVIYEPNTPEDVEMLIAYLRRKEPAIINLDNIEDTRAQRVLDFVSGALFALNGSIQRVSSNIFLLCPEGIQVTAPLETARQVY